MLVPWVIWAGKATHLWVKFQPYFRFDTPTFPFKFLLLKFMMMLLWNVNFPWDTPQNSHHMLTWRTRLGFKIIEVETSQCLKSAIKCLTFMTTFMTSKNESICNTKLPLFVQKLSLSIEHKCDPFEVILVQFLKISKGIIKSYTPIGVPLFLSIQN